MRIRIEDAGLTENNLGKDTLAPAPSAVPPAVGDGWKKARELWRWILRASRKSPRRLRLCESLPLGERRFVAVVEFEQARFLVGGTSASLVLLARLESPAAGEEERR
jgi:hypothetical protein